MHRSRLRCSAPLVVRQVNGTTEALRQQLLASDSNYIQCPNPTCGNVIERMELGSHDDGRELPRHAPDGQPLTEDQAKHMQQNRFRCEACCSNFCAGCKALPYHTAATCQEAAAARCAAKCRFCQSQLPRGAKDGSSCESAECDERLSTSCEVKLMCGHQCLGVFGESQCAPCLECADRADEFCNICWTEELRGAPCIRLRFDPLHSRPCKVLSLLFSSADPHTICDECFRLQMWTRVPHALREGATKTSLANAKDLLHLRQVPAL